MVICFIKLICIVTYSLSFNPFLIYNLRKRKAAFLKSVMIGTCKKENAIKTKVKLGQTEVNSCSLINN